MHVQFGAKYIEEGMAILTLFTFWRGWGHDVIVAQVMSTQLQNRQ